MKRIIFKLVLLYLFSGVLTVANWASVINLTKVNNYQVYNDDNIMINKISFIYQESGNDILINDSAIYIEAVGLIKSHQAMHSPDNHKVVESRGLVIKRKGKCILLSTKPRVNAAKEKGKKFDKSNKNTGLLLSKLGKLDQSEMVHTQVPEKWRPERK
jgi:hypothetical protein